VKAFCTHHGFHAASAALQVYGGYGYVAEYGIEQTVRDARIAMVYEGTNEIQAIDLLQRKVLADGGQCLAALLADLAAQLPAGHAGHGRIRRLDAVTATLTQAAPGDATLPYEVADDYLRAVALVLLDWAWARIAATPGAQVARWQAPCQAITRHVLPEFDMRMQIIETRCAQSHERAVT
ncbi:MAG: acyl-CoA dehydrogenase family protein, partial [Ramlibacter sp.]